MQRVYKQRIDDYEKCVSKLEEQYAENLCDAFDSISNDDHTTLANVQAKIQSNPNGLFKAFTDCEIGVADNVVLKPRGPLSPLIAKIRERRLNLDTRASACN